MSPEWFDHQLGLIEEKRKHHIRQSISAEERLAITLRYSASGDSQQLIAFLFKVGHSTVNGIINEICDKLRNALFGYVSPPSNGSDWKKIVADSEQTWNRPHCVGTIDRMHIAMKKLALSGSLWYNYKGVFQHGFACNMWCSLQFYSNKCWTIWEQQWFWHVVKHENGKKFMTLVRKCRFFFLVTKSFPSVNNWEMKQEKFITTGSMSSQDYREHF